MTRSTITRPRLDAFALAQVDHWRLITHAKATLAAAGRGERDPLTYLRAEMTRRHLLPAPDAQPLHLLAAPCPPPPPLAQLRQRIETATACGDLTTLATIAADLLTALEQA